MRAFSPTSPDAEARSDSVTAPAHLPSLDGLRGIAIILVILHQLDLLVRPVGHSAQALSAVFTTGWIGVQLFFVLSGFLITGILLDTRRATNYLSGFFAKRVLRIFPLYYATLFVAFVVVPAFGSVPPELAHDQKHQIWLWTYLSNWVIPYEQGSRAFPHFWSLAVEEQFYLVWPFLIRACDARRCAQVCLAIAVTSLVARIAMVCAGAPREAIYTFSVTRMDALALGAIAAAALRMPPVAARLGRLGWRLWAAAFAVAVVGALVTHGYSLRRDLGNTIGYTVLALVFAALVLGAAMSDRRRAPGWAALLRTRPLRIAGKYSYGMYIFHKPLHDFVGKPLLRRWGVDVSQSPLGAVAYTAVFASLTFAAAFVSYQLFEGPILRWKKRFAPRANAD